MKRERVTFYKEDNDNILAFFPDVEWSRGTYMCYSHVGQHSGCCPSYVEKLPLSSVTNYTPLLQELTSIGYDLIVIQ